MEKVVCDICKWQGRWADTLSAINPFDEEDEITGCPECKSIESLYAVCDEPGCWKRVSCGTPTKNGYRSTCGKHCPKKEEGK